MLRNFLVDLNKPRPTQPANAPRPATEPQFQVPASDDGINFKKLLSEVTRLWYLVVIGVAISLGVAYVINKFAIPEYSTFSHFHISNENNPLSGVDLVIDPIGAGKKSNGSVDKLVAVLKSRKHNEKVVDRLNLDISYFSNSGFVPLDIYKSSPFEVIVDTLSNDFSGLQIYIAEGVDARYLEVDFNREVPEWVKAFDEIEIDGNAIQIPFTWGENLIYPGLNLTLYKKTSGYLDYNQYFFVLNNNEKLIESFMDRASISTIFESDYLFKIEIKDENLQRAVDYVNTSIEVYQEYEVEEKNQQAENTIDFIQNQIILLTDTLGAIQENLNTYKKSHYLIDVNSESQALFDRRTTLQNVYDQLELKRHYYTYLWGYLDKEDDYFGLVAPSAIGIEDVLLHNLVDQLVNLSIEIQEIRVSVKDSSPLIDKKKEKLVAVRSALLENLDNLLKANDLQIERVSQNIDEVNQKLSSIPSKEQRFLNIQREFDVTNNQLIFLLQKLSEMQLIKAGTTPNTVVIDSAINSGQDPIYPKPVKNYLYSLIFGLAIPLGFIIGNEMMGERITDENEIIKATSIPIIGRVCHSSLASSHVVRDNPNSRVSECFRGIRSNIRYALKDGYLNDEKKSKTILITSSVGGEGKTFISINLATSFAVSGKKTVLVELDLRKPKVLETIDLDNSKGVSTYLGGMHKLDHIIQTLPDIGLDVISSGPIAPSPSELILSAKFNQLYEELKERYDYIIFDTAPMGVVSDANELMQYSDVNLYVTRHNYTRKFQLEPLASYYKEKRAKKLYVIYNNVPENQGAFGYGFGYDKMYN